MSTSFPTGLDSMVTLVDNVDQILAAHQNDRADAIEATETKVGTDSSAVATSIDYFLKHASGAYRIHQHDASSDDGAKLDWDNCWSDAVHNHSSNAEGGGIEDFKSGDWILSTITTARTGWTNVSATYANKFMRINATPLTTGGVDTHTHTLTTTDAFAHSHSPRVDGFSGGSHFNGGDSWITDSGPSAGVHNHTATTASGNNVPAYVQVVVFQKD